MSVSRRALQAASWMTIIGYLRIAISAGGNILLARILLPDDFGVFTLAISIQSIIFMLAGFGSQESIIQCRDEKIRGLIPTAFWISILLGLILALLSTSVAIILRGHYQETVIQLLIALSWLNLFNILGYAYGAILERKLSYRPIAIINFIATLLSFTFAIAAAMLGVGPWALVIREAMLGAVLLFGLRWASKYRLAYVFNIQAARWIWSFGWRMLVSRTTEVILDRVDKLIVGTFLGTSSLGYYSLSYRFALLGQRLTQGPIQPVIFSTFAAVQESREKLKYGFKRVNYWLLRGALLLGLIVFFLGQNLVLLLLGENWERAGRVLQSMSIFFIFVPLYGSLKNFLVGSGNVNNVVQVRVWQLVFTIPAMGAAAYWGDLITFVWVLNVSYFISWLLLAQRASDVVELNWGYLIKGGIIAFFFTGVTALAVFYLVLPSLHPLVDVLIRGSFVLGMYVIILFLVERNQILNEWEVIRVGLTKRN